MFWKSEEQIREEEKTEELLKIQKLESLKKRIASTDLSFKFTPTAHKRFLIALKYNVDDAYNAMVSHSLWREKKDIEKTCTLENCPNEVAKRFVTLGGPDRSGRPVFIIF